MKKVTVKPRKEASEQIEFVAWLNFNYPHVFHFSIPNEGKSRSNALESIFMKKLGLRKGVPDYFVALGCAAVFEGVSTRCNGLFIEFKRKGEKSRPDQLRCQDELRASGYYVITDAQCEQAKAGFLQYISA